MDARQQLNTPGYVRIDHAPPVVVFLGFDGTEPSDTGVVDEDVEPARPARRLVDERLHRVRVADIGFEREHSLACTGQRGELLLGAAKPLVVDARDGHGCAMLKEDAGNRAADAAGPPRHNRDLPLQSVNHKNPS